MKLVLCSEGFHTKNSVQACVELCGKPQSEIKVAIINEAYAVEVGDKHWVLDNLNDVARNFPGGIDLINLLALPIDEIEKRIADADVLFVVGGNTDYLMHVFDKTGLSELLPRLLKTKVYVGSSAGSMVIGRRISNKAYETVYDEHNDFDVQSYLGLVDLAIKPHLNSAEFPNNRPEILEQVAGGMPFPVYGLQDDSALVVNDADQTFIGTKPYKVAN